MPERATIAGVELSHPAKKLFPDAGVTKQEIAQYYESVAGWLLPHIANRPLTIVRCPDGRNGECFYQKHVTKALPDIVESVSIRERGGTRPYICVSGLRGVIALVQMGALEFHTWGSRTDRPEKPDQLVFDLDPGQNVEWSHVVEGARRLRDVLKKVGLEGFLKTSGGKGLHIVVPIERRSTWEEAKEFGEAVARRLAIEQPERYVASASKSKREGRVYIDYLRNSRGATSVVAYGLRAKPDAPVSTPLRWKELSTSTRSDRYRISNIRRRLSGLSNDPWEGFFNLRQRISKDSIDALSA